MKLDPAQHGELDRLARVMVAQTFFGPMLRQMRNSPFKSELFSGGRGGQAFQAQLDQKLAERMASAPSGNRLAKSIVKSLERKMGIDVTATDRA
jgi:Rod binding domain-containing protein